MKTRFSSAVVGMLALFVSASAMAGGSGQCCLPDGMCKMITESDCAAAGGDFNADGECPCACPPEEICPDLGGSGCPDCFCTGYFDLGSAVLGPFDPPGGPEIDNIFRYEVRVEDIPAGIVGFQIKFDYSEDFVPDSSWASDLQVKVCPISASCDDPDDEDCCADACDPALAYIVGGLTNLPDADEFWSFQGEISDPAGPYGCTDADVFLPPAWGDDPLGNGLFQVCLTNDWLGDTTPNNYDNIKIRFILRQTTVACCFPNSECADLEPPDCLQQGGTPQEPGTTCASVECPQITFPCCFPIDGSCQDLEPEDCIAMGGEPQFDQTRCANITCPPPAPVACCFPNSECADLAPLACIQQGGVPQDPETECATFVCPQITFPCCFEDGSCLDLEPEDCIQQGGEPQLDDTRCADITCPGPPNPVACCFQDGSCQDLTPAACTTAGGFPQAPGTACATTECPIIRKGACCLADQVCVIVTADECESLGGRYQGDNTLCDPNPCPPTGACCLPGGFCEIQAEENCIAAQGEYQGDDTVCAPDTCEARGACCFDDGTCIDDLTQSACNDEMGGEWQGDGVDCTDDLCPPTKGACCLDGGACTVVTPVVCDELVGDYQGDNTVCSPGLCPIEGACCFPDGTCLLATQDDCGDLGGLFQGDNVPCTDDLCPVTIGACCLDDGTCVDVLPAECTEMEGYFEGRGTQCAFTDCTGACCMPDGSCEDLSFAECEIAEGDFRGSDSECATTDCPGFFARALIIKQGACPAPIHPDSNGLTKMLVVGDTNLDVFEVDLSTLQLSRCDGVGNYVGPERIAIKDLNHPEDQVIGCEPGQNPCACNQNQSSDGVDDIELKFRTSEMRDELELGDLPPDTIITLSLTGELIDGREFTALDCVRIVGGALPDGATRLAVLANGNDVWIDSAPPDNIFDDGGFADFDRTHPRGTVVHLTAPPTHNGATFAGWNIDGQPVSADRLLTIEMTDEIHVVEPIFEDPIAGDVNGDGIVGLDDLLAVLFDWGDCVDCPADINGDNVVDFQDLLILLGNWG